MKREDARRESARALAAKVGGLAEFGRKTGMENSQVSQIIGKTPTKNIGNIVAKRIEDAFGLESGWLDRHPCGDGAGGAQSAPNLAGEELAANDEPPATYVERVDRDEMKLLEAYRLMSAKNRERLMSLADDTPKIELPFRARHQ